MSEDLTRYLVEFEEQKAEVRGNLSKGNRFPYSGELDPELSEIVRALNELDFVLTWQTCAGHFMTRSEMESGSYFPFRYEQDLPQPGFGLYADGFIQLIFSPKEESRRFIADLDDLADRYSGACAHRRGTIIETEDPNLQGLFIDLYFDDSNGTAWKPIELTEQEGKARIGRVARFRSDLYELVKRYDPATRKTIKEITEWSELEEMAIRLDTCISPENEDAKIYPAIKQKIENARADFVLPNVRYFSFDAEHEFYRPTAYMRLFETEDAFILDYAFLDSAYPRAVLEVAEHLRGQKEHFYVTEERAKHHIELEVGEKKNVVILLDPFPKKRGWIRKNNAEYEVRDLYSEQK